MAQGHVTEVKGIPAEWRSFAPARQHSKDGAILLLNAAHCLLIRSSEAKTIIVSRRPYEYLESTMIAEQCRRFGEDGQYDRKTRIFRWHNGATTLFECVSSKPPMSVGRSFDSWVMERDAETEAWEASERC